jgi:hypothetical protein
MALVRADVSKESIASIVKVTTIGKLRTLAVNMNRSSVPSRLEIYRYKAYLPVRLTEKDNMEELRIEGK